MIDFDSIKNIYNPESKLRFEDIEPLIQSAQYRSYEVGDYLIKEGSLKKEIFFIVKGLVRVFIINEKGDEITTLLRWENQFFIEPNVVIFNQPSAVYVEALEPTDTFSMDFKVVQSLLAGQPKLEETRRYVLRAELLRALKHVNTFILLTPEKRYLEFIQSNPDIVNRVPNKYIANVLGITPVSLSRIRKRIASQKRTK